MEFTDIQIAYMRSILLIERTLEPKCLECGVGVSRPKCFHELGSSCERQEQDDTVKYNQVVRELETISGLSTMYGWRNHAPLEKVISISEEEKLLILDFMERSSDFQISQRSSDDRYVSLAKKGVFFYSSRDGRHYITATSRGKNLIIDICSK